MGGPYSNMTTILTGRGDKDTDTHTWREDYVKTEREDSHLQTKEKGFQRN